MPYNLSIPGEIREVELRAIELTAREVPVNGVVVEVGSYLGCSGWAWAKSVHPSVTIFCIDLWGRYRNPQPAPGEKQIIFSLDTFREYTKDCPNIVPLKGCSPNDFQHWDKPIDVYFEDAVHTNPILAANLKFWCRHLRPSGIACGHDYVEKFPDVVQEVKNLAELMRRQVGTVSSFWCLPPEGSPLLTGLQALLASSPR